MEMGSPHHADLVSPMLVATSVVDVPPVPHLVVECVQHGPVIDFAVSAPAVVPAALAPMVEFVTNVKGTQRIQFDSSLVF